ncbi:MAG: hypothetical protein ACWGOL_00915 [Desulfuromonadales bacterium]
MFMSMGTASQLDAAEQDQAASIRGSIIALDSARRTALREIAELPPDNGEVSDYQDFIVYLSTRIVSYCRDLAEQSGVDALEGLPCPSGPLVAGSVAASPTAAEQQFSSTGGGVVETRTQEEKTAALEGDFLASLGDFDDMLLKEENKVAARVPSQRETSASGRAGSSNGDGTASGTGENTAASDAAANGGAEAQGAQSGPASGQGESIGAGNGNQESSVYGVPGGTLPPPKDDDIVARQLREAAEKETDPELKKKLWEEYWKYKGKKT